MRKGDNFRSMHSVLCPASGFIEEWQPFLAIPRSPSSFYCLGRTVIKMLWEESEREGLHLHGPIALLNQLQISRRAPLSGGHAPVVPFS